jgi:hypothetical protein
MRFLPRRSRQPAWKRLDHVRLILLALILAPGGTFCLLSTANGQGPASAPKIQTPHPHPPSTESPDVTPPEVTPKQQQGLLKANYEKLKQDTDELAGLVKSLQDDLNKSNQNVLSLQIVEKTSRIEKLSKRIKTEAVR